MAQNASCIFHHSDDAYLDESGGDGDGDGNGDGDDGDDDDEKGVANALSANCLKVCTWLRIGSEDRSDPDFQNPQSLCISAANWPHFQCLILRSAFIRHGFSLWCQFRTMMLQKI